MVLDDWVAALEAELDVNPDAVDVRLLLDVARDAAHNVDRPAAPLSTFLVGYAAGLRGGGGVALEAAALAAQQLAQSWTPPPTDE